MPRRESLLWLGLIIALALALCRPFLRGEAVLGFRDTAHFYYPLFQWLDDQRLAGGSTQWIPYDGCGVPALADAGTSPAYPLQLIWLARGWSFPVRFGLYVTVHLLLASCGAFWVARRLRLRPSSAALAGLSYGLGGVTLSQTCNLVYLIGSAWLPWLVGGLVGWLLPANEQNTPGFGPSVWNADTVVVAISVALLVVGGDVQTAYLGLLVAGVAVCLQCVAGGHNRSGRDSQPTVRCSVLRLVIAVALAAGLSATVWLPQSAWNQTSVRTYTIAPRSIWEWLAQGNALPAPAGNAALEVPSADEWEATYEFSLPPWTLLECWAPQLWGKLYPQHRRWDAGLPAADRVWYPSIYPGFLVTLLLLAGLGVSLSRRRAAAGPQGESGLGWPVRGMLWSMCLLGIFGAFGWYGLGWVWREFSAMIGAPAAPALAPQVGGVYWCLQWLLPGFCQFRYPAKLLVLASLAAPLLAALAWEQWWTGADGGLRAWSRWMVRLGLAQAGLGIGAALIVFAGESNLVLSFPPPDPSFGPFDLPGARRDLQAGLVHATLCGLSVAGLASLATRVPRVARGASTALILLAAADLTLANAWLLPAVPLSAAFDTGPASPGIVSAPADAANGHSSTTGAVPGGDLLERSVDPAWISSSSPDRLAEILRFHRGTNFPNFHLLSGQRILPAFNSLEPLDRHWLLAWAAAHPSEAAELWPLVGLGHWDAPAVAVVAWPAPQAGLVQGADSNQPSPAALRRQARLRSSDQPRFEELLAADLAALRTRSVAADCEVVPIAPRVFTQTRVRVECQQACRVVIGNAWTPAWQATVRDVSGTTSRPVPVERFAGILQSVVLEQAGDYELVVSYQPQTAWIGELLSLATAAGLVLCGILRRIGAGCRGPRAFFSKIF